MASRVTIAGVAAVLRWGYQPAGTLGAWTVARGESGPWTLTATVVGVDTFRVAQRPLVFVAPHATGSWRWPIVELQIVGASLTATLGPKES